MAVFSRSVVIDAPVADVFRFHERPDALSLLSPPFPPVRVVAKTGRALEAGARVELRVGFFRWVAVHTACETDRLFVDEQVEGPFAKWIHRHEFEALDSRRARLTDRVEYELPGGPLVNFALGWIVALGLRSLFSHRHRVTRDGCGRLIPQPAC